MYAEIYSHEAEGIQCVFDNKKWVVCIKNWKPNNDAAQIEYLEIHHETDEQFILVEGKALLLAEPQCARLRHPGHPDGTREGIQRPPRDLVQYHYPKGYQAGVRAGRGYNGGQQRVSEHDGGGAGICASESGRASVGSSFSLTPKDNVMIHYITSHKDLYKRE